MKNKLIKSSEILVYPPNSNPLGYSYREWCKKWCQWIATIPKKANPTSDNSGLLTRKAQLFSKVIFLCQTFESVPMIPHRQIEFIAGQYVFMPIINWISVQDETNNGRGLRKLAKKMMDEVVKLHLSVNGKTIPIDLSNFRFQSPIFNVLLPSDNIFDVRPGKTAIVADGFWIFFKALVKNLEIETLGACRSGRTHIAVDYHLNSSQ